MAEETKDFETALAEATARGSNVIPGVVLSAVDRHGKEIYSKAVGYNGLSSDAPPITKDATFWLASCTKLPASIAALQCVERGLLGLDDPVEKWLPELKDKQIVSLEGSNVKLTTAKNKVTLRHLLTHTSGFTYGWSEPEHLAWYKAENAKGVDFRSFAGTVKKLYDLPLLFEPGEGWVYGPGIDWAGVLVERLNDNITLGDYLQKEIFGRLGTEAGKSTTFRLNSAVAKENKIKERLLLNAHRQDDGSLKEQPVPFSQDVSEDSGGAGWYSSVSDYIAILQDLISPEPKLLSKEHVEEWLYSPHITNKKAIEQLLKARTDMVTQGGTDGGSPMNYALGGLIWVKDADQPKGTLAWGGLPNLKWFANREKGVAAMYASQVTPHGDPQSQVLAAEFAKEVWRLYGN